LVVPLQGVQEEDAFLQAIGELMAAKQQQDGAATAGSSGSSNGSSLSAEMKEAALAWGKQQGMSVRSAAVFARSCM
jgi:hypothetical protein